MGGGKRLEAIPRVCLLMDNEDLSLLDITEGFLQRCRNGEQPRLREFVEKSTDSDLKELSVAETATILGISKAGQVAATCER